MLIPLILFGGCRLKKTGNTDVGKLGINEEVAAHLRRFEGRGALTDDSRPLPAKVAVGLFETAPDLKIELVLAEPKVKQPVEMKFDRKGRLWVVQYNQYPYPEGLKITGVDNHLRLKFDKVPAPPPSGVKGADKITFFEDTDGDGMFDKATDAFTGLNIATSVLPAKKRIWVLSPPYLLAYRDRNEDGLPEGDPEVHLEGFGLEDTHAIANSLRWGPDGWIYGAQGSTATATINSKASKNVHFSGQAIWRYHPETGVFEVFGEGGGNTFNVEIDGKGRIYSGQNAYGRGPYYKQGCYYKKSWGKHGPLTNPYAFGYLPDMEFEGENIRFTHALIRYEGGALPARYDRNFIALNPLQGHIMLTEVTESGSTLRNRDLGKIVQTKDRWFRPIDIKTGPDGNVYFTDWYDSRLSHVDARDTWHKNSGRIYRLVNRANPPKPERYPDITALSTPQLVEALRHKNRWYRFAALEELGDRADLSVLPALQKALNSGKDAAALECLWAIHLLGKYDEATALTALRHADPYVREWAVRLIGDRKKATAREASALAALAAEEANASVRSQLAASARRFPGKLALEISRNLVMHHDDSTDPEIPLIIWWALEAKAETDRADMVSLFSDEAFRKRPLVREVLLERIVQRYAMAGGAENYAACEAIMRKVPGEEAGLKMLTGLEEGLRGASAEELPAGLKEVLERYRKLRGEPEFAAGVRQKDKQAVAGALAVIKDEKRPAVDRLTYVRLMGTAGFPESVPVLLGVLSGASSGGALKQAALASLERYDTPEIGDRVVKLYPDHLRADPTVKLSALSLLSSRAVWAGKLLAAVQGIQTIKPEDVPIEVVNRIKRLGDAEIAKKSEEIWANARSTSGSERNERIAAVQKMLKNGTGDAKRGQELFTSRCGSCHKLFGTGGEIGPELTGYDRRDVSYFILNTVDPNADIREGYATYTLQAKTGQTVVGRLVEQTSQMVRIKPMAGEEQTFARKEIESLEPLPVSLMPERLLDDLSEQEVRDLFRYITTGLEQ